MRRQVSLNPQENAKAISLEIQSEASNAATDTGNKGGQEAQKGAELPL